MRSQLRRRRGWLALALLLTALACLYLTKERLMHNEVAHAETTASAQPLLDLEQPATFKTATFALGCFWGPDAQFGALPGVLRTRVGYCGGTLQNPTYHHLGNHTETVEIDYDPALLSYAQLLEIYFASHSPASEPYSEQYKAAVFCHDATQRSAAEGALAAWRAAAPRALVVHTQILDYTRFWPAEDYHQKYALKRDQLLSGELERIFPGEQAMTNSTAVARLNGYVQGWGPREQLERELPKLGLSETGQRHLVQMWERYGAGERGPGC